MKAISIICVYNNKQQLEECLLRSLKSQDVEYELILVDGSCGKYKSCAEALNSGVKKSNGDILVFAHQDVFLKSKEGLKEFTRFIDNEQIGTIVGCAGAIEKERENKGNYTSGLVVDSSLLNQINDPIQVSCIDECFFGMKRITYDTHHFNESICDNWHLYAVEQCLYHRMNGGIVYVFPLQIHHLSNGKISLKYMDSLVRMSEYYHKHFDYIWTTCYKVRCSPIYCSILRNVWLLNRIIKGRGY